MKTTHTVTCADGYAIGTNHFAPDGSPVKAQILMAGATGVPQGFYERFATLANTRGYAVRTLDYRGIGASAPKQLRSFQADYLDWGRLDLTATLAHMQGQSPTLPVFMVGHSYGGQGFGLMANHSAVHRFYTFGTGAGWHGHMPAPERYKVWMLWNLIGTLIVPMFGYMPGKMIGGEDLPLGIYRQWRHWCKFPHYFFDDPEVAPVLKHFAEVRTPIRAACSIDDLWIPPRSRDHFFKGYTHAPITTVDLRPADLGLRSIGHMGYFRKTASPLWEAALDWFDECFDGSSGPRQIGSGGMTAQ
jgi:predicted alpha/beta hydrolase